ncbi:MAG: glutamine amidotransferase [Thermoguttaceae bacterium]
MLQLYFYPVGDSYLLVALVALGLLALLLLGPGASRIPPRRRRILLALRMAAILALLFAMLRPTIVYATKTPLAASIVILADLSRSMTIPDEVNGQTRYQALQRTLEDSSDALKELGRRFQIKAYGFDRNVRPLEVADGKIDLPAEPEGRETAIGQSLDTVLRQEAGERLLGVFLLSDGAQRALPPADLLPQQAANQLRSRGDSLWTLRYGQSKGLGQARDLAVKELTANDQVFVNNELSVAGRVRVDGFANKPVSIRLLFETSPDKLEPVAAKELTARADGEEVPFEFRYAPAQPGEHKLTVEVVEQPGELVTTNNRISTFVNVLKGGLRVLLLVGFPPNGYEANFLRRALDASPDIHVDTFLIDPRHKPETRPADLADRFKPGQYEVYILGDLDSSVFEAGELESLAEAVSGGAGLIMLGGFHSFGPGGYADTPLANLLPVSTNRLERQAFDSAPRSDVHIAGPVRMVPTRISQGHFTMLLSRDLQENQQLWTQLPPLLGANKFRDMKGLASVLAESEKKEPLLVAQPFDRGRVMAFAGDSTWQWQMHGFENAHKRFWRQVVLWLARKDQSLEGNVWVELPQRQFQRGRRVEFTVGVLAATGEPVRDARGQAVITLPDGSQEKLDLTVANGILGGSFRQTAQAGDYAIEATVSQQAAVLGSARARFLVIEQDLELDNASADAGVMDSLAAMTGGKALVSEELPDALRQLGSQGQSLVETTEVKQSLWDSWLLFLTLVGFLGVEWYLRKKWGLV